MSVTTLAAKPPHHDNIQEALIDRIAGSPSAEQIQSVRQVLDSLEADPRGRLALSQMHNWYQRTGEVPRIILIKGPDASLPRPDPDTPDYGLNWHFDLDTLNAASTDDAVCELITVFRNMVGDMSPFLDEIQMEMNRAKL